MDGYTRVCTAENARSRLAGSRFYVPVAAKSVGTAGKNIMRMKEDMKARYFDAPDLQHIGKNAYRFINAVSDFATHGVENG